MGHFTRRLGSVRPQGRVRGEPIISMADLPSMLGRMEVCSRMVTGIKAGTIRDQDLMLPL
jgi:hypothetical protein